MFNISRCVTIFSALGLIGLVISCSPQQETSSSDNYSKKETKTVTTPSNISAATIATVPNSATIPTTSFEPTPIKITVADLPEPYATQSSSNSPNVISIPANPVLQVPAGFQVNVFAEGLDRPRWLTLTPEGDILVAESYNNRLRRLSDRDGDGVAEINQIFATSANGINQPLGMAFTDDAFYVANTGEVLRFDYQVGQTELTGKGTTITQLTPKEKLDKIGQPSLVIGLGLLII